MTTRPQTIRCSTDPLPHLTFQPDHPVGAGQLTISSLARSQGSSASITGRLRAWRAERRSSGRLCLPRVHTPLPVRSVTPIDAERRFEGGFNEAAAAELLKLKRRQVFRLVKAFRTQGAPGLISKKRGQPGNRRKPEDVRYAALARVRERHADFGPTLAAEKLAELHDLRISRESLRKWVIGAGLWVDRLWVRWSGGSGPKACGHLITAARSRARRLALVNRSRSVRSATMCRRRGKVAGPLKTWRRNWWRCSGWGSGRGRRGHSPEG